MCTFVWECVHVYGNVYMCMGIDALSRLPIDSEELVSTNSVSEIQLQQFQEIRVTAKQVAEGIQKNPTLAKVLHLVKTGWPREVEKK